MKKSILYLLLILCIQTGFSQDNTSVSFFNLSNHVGGFGGFEFTFNKDGKAIIIGEGAFLYRNFYIGGFGNGSIYNDQLSKNDDQIYSLNSGQGGFSLGAYSNTNKKIALFIECKFGFGEAYAKRELSENIYEEYSSFLYTTTPKMGISYNPIKPIQVRLDTAYQFTNKFDLNGISNSAFKGLIIGIGIYLGYF